MYTDISQLLRKPFGAGFLLGMNRMLLGYSFGLTLKTTTFIFFT